MKFYSVITTYNDFGKVGGWFGDRVEAAEKPALKREEKEFADIYTDYFYNFDDAQEFLYETIYEA